MKQLIKKLAEMPSKKADKGSNGYFVAKGFWGTCFNRIATKLKDVIEIRHNSSPTNFHTYTRIAENLFDRVYFVYANPKEGISMILPPGGRIVGMSNPTPSGEYMNYSLLVYSPTGEEPAIEEYPEKGVFIEKRGEMHKFHPEIAFSFRGKPHKRLFFNEEGFAKTKYNIKQI